MEQERFYFCWSSCDNEFHCLVGGLQLPAGLVKWFGVELSSRAMGLPSEARSSLTWEELGQDETASLTEGFHVLNGSFPDVRV